MKTPTSGAFAAFSSLVVFAVLGCSAVQTASESSAAAGSVRQPTTALTADEAWKRLEEGNTRFATGHSRAIADHSGRRAELSKGQHPFAVVVSCSDSRVVPEIVFDQGLGDLFVIRTAGEVVDDDALGSIEYAVEHLGSSLIVVLGHTRCGAVTAAVEGGTPPGHIVALTKAIQPAVEQTRGQQGDSVENAVRDNVREVVKQLSGSAPILSESVHEGKVSIVGAEYNLDTGRVARTD